VGEHLCFTAENTENTEELIGISDIFSAVIWLCKQSTRCYKQLNYINVHKYTFGISI